ncbi:hypothetical protein [Lysobacter sp. BMK333-48F3]|nr:hypothetical protein [Lysobacter sp. BMK333-48F3]
MQVPPGATLAHGVVPPVGVILLSLTTTLFKFVVVLVLVKTVTV